MVSTKKDTRTVSVIFSPPFAHVISAIKLMFAFFAAFSFSLEDLSSFLTLIAFYLIFNQVTTYIYNENPEKRIEYIDLASSFFSEIVILSGILFGYILHESPFPRLIVLSLLVVTLAISYVNAKFGSLKINSKFVYFENSTRIALLLLGGVISQLFSIPFVTVLMVLLTFSVVVLLLQLFYANDRLST